MAELSRGTGNILRYHLNNIRKNASKIRYGPYQ